MAKFQVGDRVRVLDRVEEFSAGTIEGVCDDKRYKVRMDYGRFRTEPPDIVVETALARLDTEGEKDA